MLSLYDTLQGKKNLFQILNAIVLPFECKHLIGWLIFHRTFKENSCH